MLEFFGEQIYLFNMLFLIFVGFGVYFYRSKTGETETSQQRLANDLYAVISVFFAFAFITFGLMMLTGNKPNLEKYIEIETLADVQRYFRLQDQELQQMRTGQNIFVGLTKNFVVAAAVMPMLVYRILKAYYQDLGRK